MSRTVARTDRPNRPIGPRNDERGTGRAFLLALFMHALLFALLFYGMRWQNSSPAGSEAELWTPAEVAEPTPPVVAPAPTPAPPAIAAPTPPAEDADIALQQKKRKQAQEAAEQARLLEAQQEKARQEALKQKQLAEQQAAADLARKKAAADEAARQQKLADQKKADELKHQKEEEAKKAEQQKQQQLADAQKKADAEKKAAEDKAAKAKAAKEAAAQKAADAARAERLAALRGMAGGTPGATGNGLGSQAGGTGSGAGGTASAGYADRVRAKVKPNIAYGGDTEGNPTAVVAVRLAPDGSVLSMQLVKSSGNPAWDAAVQAAITKSDPLPRDTNGKAPPSVNLRFSPKG
ncbi:cell envelope integrity protein TolA [Pandoraea fibrosis]|uniref:Protein TolA n=1 Tax=Pandoraea fibrosis TaxID=1891094 RepID=A0A5E4SQI6_9BURK|nr:cell envelope integrity protein TolA [Pandoraea fibrosis]QHE91869.1 cell envelope integrity protein TolA [Pandoraea fibrosis]QHF14574.1 cell envelope integrity protein TolA [Pandoraea fibrosis]VVD77163.1 protein TolA [Pandoraea fibrosis]